MSKKMGNTMLHSRGTFCQSLEVTQDEVKIKELEASTKCSKKFSYLILFLSYMLCLSMWFCPSLLQLGWRTRGQGEAGPNFSSHCGPCQMPQVLPYFEARCFDEARPIANFPFVAGKLDVLRANFQHFAAWACWHHNAVAGVKLSESSK